MRLKLGEVWDLLLVMLGIVLFAFKVFEFIAERKGGSCIVETTILAFILVAGTHALVWVRADYIFEKEKRRELEYELNCE